MNNIYSGANLIDKKKIKLFLFSDKDIYNKNNIFLIIDNIKKNKLNIIKEASLNGISILTLESDEVLELGHSYFVEVNDFLKIPLNVSNAIDFSDFDSDYTYHGEDLGCSYFNKYSIFKIWAPLSSNAYLVLRLKNEEKETLYKMNRGKYGVFEIKINKDLENYLYHYLLVTNETNYRVLDPYGKASNSNSKENIVIDLKKTNIDMYDKNLPYYDTYLNTIIYELGVRDFTIDENSDIKNKGKYLGLTEENRKTLNGNKAGIDYIESLGITHVQILPFYDFKTTDDNNPKDTYNWGYDPWQYFVPEGSFSLNPDDGYSRIIECKKMIQAFHKKKIKVNMDVVFNHFYDTMMNTLANVVPGYFIRKTNNGDICNGSGCGNDFNSKRPMARKLIIDCVKYWIKEYSIDGIRMDLMGLIDVDTVLKLTNEARKLKSDFMVYGEGWDISTNLDSNEKSSILNSFRLDEIGFFNDSYRDIIKGPTGENSLKTGGYFTSNPSYIEGVKFSFLSSSLDYVYPARFKYPHQSLNYVECHDNHTLFDKVNSIYSDKNDINLVLKIVRQINAFIILSIGIPFLHAGQEIGLTKFNCDNTYNKGDKFNKFRYDILDERIEMVNYLKTMIDFRKSFYNFNIDNPKEIEKRVKFENLEDNILKIDLINLDDKKLTIVVNPNDFNKQINFNNYKLLVCSDDVGYITNFNLYIKNTQLQPHSILIFLEKEEEND